MGPQSRQPDSSLNLEALPERLRAHPGDFSFFQAVRLLQRLRQVENPIGSFDPPSREAVRIGVRPSLSFPPTEIQSLQDNPAGPLKMTVTVFGLTGPLGVLPTRYSELLIERMYAHDPTLKDFLRSEERRVGKECRSRWSPYRFPVAYERSGADRFT